MSDLSLPPHDELRAGRRFDVAIVGGGITGAWTALYCAEAGLSTVVLERGDFGGETSSASSKLLHGGIRYLQQLQFGRVRESTMERAAYQAAAPHVTRAVPFVVPTFPDLKRSKAVMGAGLALYRTLGIGQDRRRGPAADALPGISTLSPDALDELCDLGDVAHTGAWVFPELQVHDTERLVWEVLDTARTHGAVLRNHCPVLDLLRDGDTVRGVTCRPADGPPLEIEAALVVNCAGPWVDRVGGADGSPLVNGFAVGAHVLTRRLVADHAVAIPTRQQATSRIDRGGRHIFVIPWRGLSLIGTSYRETDEPDGAALLDRSDLVQLLDAVNTSLPAARLGPTDVISAYCGLYPLQVEQIDGNRYQGTGEYVLIDHATGDGRAGLVTALGAKYTTGRTLGEQAARLVLAKLDDAPPEARRRAASRAPFHVRLAAADYDSLPALLERSRERHGDRFDAAQIEHLVRCYGSRIDAFVAFVDAAGDRDRLLERMVSTQPDVYGQVAWAVEREMAVHLDDVLLGRTSIGLLGIDEPALARVARTMGERLGWSGAREREELEPARARRRVIAETVDHHYAKAS